MNNSMMFKIWLPLQIFSINKRVCILVLLTTAIQPSAVVQYQLKIVYGVCIAHIMRACKHTIYINFESALYLRVLAI